MGRLSQFPWEPSLCVWSDQDGPHQGDHGGRVPLGFHQLSTTSGRLCWYFYLPRIILFRSLYSLFYCGQNTSTPEVQITTGKKDLRK